MEGTDKKWPTPPPGVSTLDGRHVEVDKPEIPQAKKQRGRKREPGDDALKNPEQYKVLRSSGMTPAGVEGNTMDVREGAMPKTRRSHRNTATFRSVDGEEYTYRTHDTKGKALPHRELMALFLAVRELSLGGSALPVFDAFKVRLTDMEGKMAYPIPEDILSRIPTRLLPEPEETPEEEKNDEFKLGE